MKRAGRGTRTEATGKGQWKRKLGAEGKRELHHHPFYVYCFIFVMTFDGRIVFGYLDFEAKIFLPTMPFSGGK